MTLKVNLGEAFAEASGTNFSRRWYLPKKNLGDGLKDLLGDHILEGGEIHIHLLSAAFDNNTQNQLSTVAFLVSSGFETHLRVRGLANDHVFGIDERTLASGKIETPVKMDDLILLKTKFDLLKVNSLALGFLHSDKNSENEARVRDYFVEQGFRVECSSDFAIPLAPNKILGGEKGRWRRALQSAQKASYVQELISDAQTSFGENIEKWKFVFKEEPTEIPAAALTERPQAGQVELSLELEKFELKTAQGHERLSLQPSQMVRLGAFGAPAFEEYVRSFEPGPLFLGRSFQLTVLDVFYFQGRLEGIEGVSSSAPEKSKARIKEALFALAKNIESETKIQGEQIASDLEKLAVEGLVQNLSSFPRGASTVLRGALAKNLFSLLEARLPDLKWKLQ